MDKKYIFFILVGLCVAGLIGIIVLLFSDSKPAGPGNTNTAIVDDSLKSFSATFVTLYESYETGKFNNLYAAGDFSTVEFQNLILQRIEQLQNSTPENYLKETIATPGSVRYVIREEFGRKVATVEVPADVQERTGDRIANYKITARLEAVQEGDRWRINSVSINR